MGAYQSDGGTGAGVSFTIINAPQRSEAWFAGVTDGFTGCMIFDQTQWTLISEIETRRLEVIGPNKGSQLGKVSNAYLMQSRHATFSVWIVNVHLKAMDFGTKSDVIEYAHTEELREILDRVAKANEDLFPVYLCGDYNNGGDKGQLVHSALLKRNVKDAVDPETGAVLV
jgi:hypothetical protein